MENLLEFAEIAAKHGIYAFVVIFVFWRYRKVVEDFKNAKPENRIEFQKALRSNRYFTYFLVLAASAIWFYSSFIYAPTPFIKGSITGLVEQPIEPRNPSEPAKVVHYFEPERGSVEFYKRKRLNDEGKYDLSWVVFIEQDTVPIKFILKQHWFRLIRDSAADPLLPQNSTKPETNLDEHTYVLNVHDGNICTPLELTYKPNSQEPKKLGKIFCRWNDNKLHELHPEIIEEEEEEIVDNKYQFRFPSIVPVAYAQDISHSMFKEDGSYTVSVGNRLRQMLSSQDKQIQDYAIDILVTEGKRTFKFIRYSLNKKATDSFEWSTILNAISETVDLQGRSRIAVPQDIKVELALAFYNMSDYEKAAYWFRQVDDEFLNQGIVFYYRGYAYSKTDGFKHLAKDSFNRFFEITDNIYAKASVKNSVGSLEFEQGNLDEAINQFKLAISLYPEYASPYNNLAFVYADRGENLNEALELVEKALELEPDDPYFLDTKGWILFKMRNYQEAYKLIKRAVTLNPQDREMQEHLLTVKAAMSQR